MAGAVFIEWFEVVVVLFVFNVDFSCARVEFVVACVSCGKAGIKYINSYFNAVENVEWASNAHDVAWLVFVNEWNACVDGLLQ